MCVEVIVQYATSVSFFETQCVSLNERPNVL